MFTRDITSRSDHKQAYVITFSQTSTESSRKVRHQLSAGLEVGKNKYRYAPIPPIPPFLPSPLLPPCPPSLRSRHP